MTRIRDWRLAWCQNLKGVVTNTVQVGGDVTVSVDDRGLSSKLDDPADDYDIAALVRVEVGRSDTGCRLGLHAGGCRCCSGIWPWGEFGA